MIDDRPKIHKFGTEHARVQIRGREALVHVELQRSGAAAVHLYTVKPDGTVSYLATASPHAARLLASALQSAANAAVTLEDDAAPQHTAERQDHETPRRPGEAPRSWTRARHGDGSGQ